MTATRATRLSLLGLLLVLLVAVSLRLTLAWKAHAPTLDTAVVGQMALDILDGERPLFFAGQSYLGALEAYLLALVFLVLPAGRVTMTLVTIGFALAWIIVTYYFFRRRHGPWAALAAALVPAIPGWSGAWYTTVPYGGYPETYFFGTLLLLLALPFLDRTAFRPSLRQALALALVAGLGLWVNLQLLPFLAAAGLAGLWAWSRHPRPLRPWLAYLIVPLAMGLALLPQLLAEPSHVEPPLFAGLSFHAVARSCRALFRHDLPHCVLWTFPPAALHRLAALLLTGLVAGGIVLAWRNRRAVNTSPSTTPLVLATLAVFSLTYFPHPMSGFVPRYLIAPTALLLSWCVALWCSAPNAWIRRTGFALALLLAAYNAAGILTTARVRAPATQQTLTEFSQVIATARDAGWNAVLYAGSETEGYDGARLTFLSQSHPVFTSAYSDRFLDHQLAWEFGDHCAILARQRHLPFVEGSFAAANVPRGTVHEAGPYVLLDTPEVHRRLERSRLPDSIDGWSGAIDTHPLFDRSAATTWPERADQAGQSLTLRFQKSARLAGLRISAPASAGLPYRYTVQVQKPDGSWITVQDCQRRIAASYLSGTRLYFRGHHPWMDIRFEPMDGTALTWTVIPGPDNPAPPHLDELFVLESSGEPWPDCASLPDTLQQMLAAAPGAQLVAERGILRTLHRHAGTGNGLSASIPLPYNPRFARTQPEQFSLRQGRYVLVMETAYAADARAVFTRAGIPILDEQTLAPYNIMIVAIDDATSEKTAWQGFRPVRTNP
ncbi:MAG: hypothetical protein RBS84_09610 [Kiritimatiellia bacterium]|jgi:hypothetical protein|nr:hypothetical protein [Kiritimatiellia bacterium]